MNEKNSLLTYSDDELKRELSRRGFARIRGLCDVCGRRPEEKSCGMDDRHTMRLQNQADKAVKGGA
jgi:hypothetical protein